MKIAADRPYSTAFARSSASSSVAKRYSDATGPKTSWHERNASSATSSKSVGSIRYPSAPSRTPPVSDAAALLPSALDRVGHLRELRLVDDRPDLDLRIERVADLPAGDALEQSVAELVVDAVLHVDAPRCRALLARRPESAGVGRLRRPAEVGVVHHDQRVVAAELELDALAERASPRRGRRCPWPRSR